MSSWEAGGLGRAFCKLLGSKGAKVCILFQVQLSFYLIHSIFYYLPQLEFVQCVNQFSTNSLLCHFQVCVADVAAEAGKSLAEQLNSSFGPGTAMFIKCDVSCQEDLESMTNNIFFCSSFVSILEVSEWSECSSHWHRLILAQSVWFEKILPWC